MVIYNEEKAIEAFEENQDILNAKRQELKERVELPEGWVFSNDDYLPETSAWGDFYNEQTAQEESGWDEDVVLVEAYDKEITNGNNMLTIFSHYTGTRFVAYIETESGEQHIVGPDEGDLGQRFLDDLHSEMNELFD